MLDFVPGQIWKNIVQDQYFVILSVQKDGFSWKWHHFKHKIFCEFSDIKDIDNVRLATEEELNELIIQDIIT